MRIILVSPIHPSGLASFQRQTLLNALNTEGFDIKAENVVCTWSSAPNAIKLQNGKPDNEFMSACLDLSTVCYKDHRLVLFDLRRVNGEIPEGICKYMQLLAVMGSLCHVLVSLEDEELLRGMFPSPFYIPPMFQTPQQFVRSQKTMQAS